jgi:hypothetical protein
MRRYIGRMDVNEGDVVRLEIEEDGTWFYCRVRGVADDEVLCSPIDAQSWPSAALSGYFPGRNYLVPVSRVLSVVQRAK